MILVELVIYEVGFFNRWFRISIKVDRGSRFFIKNVNLPYPITLLNSTFFHLKIQNSNQIYMSFLDFKNSKIIIFSDVKINSSSYYPTT